MTEHDLNYWLNERNVRFCYSAFNPHRRASALNVYEVDGKSAIALITPNGCQLFLPADIPEPGFRYFVADSTGKERWRYHDRADVLRYAMYLSWRESDTIIVMDGDATLAMYCNGEDLEVTK